MLSRADDYLATKAELTTEVSMLCDVLAVIFRLLSLLLHYIHWSYHDRGGFTLNRLLICFNVMLI